MIRKMGYDWHLRQLMATHGMFQTSDLLPLLEERGIHLSREQVYRLVTQPPQKLAFLQRIPHIDSATGRGLATVHYLFRQGWGGTAFYRHRSTGYEYVDEARELPYFTRLQEESGGADAPGPAYIGEDTPLFERVDKVDGVYNRMLVYRRNSLHSATIDNANVPPPDPLTGRLSINTFIDVLA